MWLEPQHCQLVLLRWHCEFVNHSYHYFVHEYFIFKKQKWYALKAEGEGRRKNSWSIMQSEWRLYSLCRRDKNKGDQFL